MNRWMDVWNLGKMDARSILSGIQTKEETKKHLQKKSANLTEQRKSQCRKNNKKKKEIQKNSIDLKRKKKSNRRKYETLFFSFYFIFNVSLFFRLFVLFSFRFLSFFLLSSMRLSIL